MSKSGYGDKGSITVEAAVLIPFIIMCILAVLFISLIYYQRALLQCAVDKTAKAGAASWEYAKMDIATGKINMNVLDDNGLYWRLLEPDREEKVKRLKEYLTLQVKKNSILKPIESEVSIEIKDYKIYKVLIIEALNTYPVPGGGIFSMFGMENHFRLKVVTSVNINDSTEFIRTTDLIMDIEKELEMKNPGIKNLAEKTRNTLSKIKVNMDRFLK